MIASRSSNGMNALFIALIVNHCSSRPAPAERLHQQRHLPRHRGAAHQPVVGVDGDPEAQVAQQPDRVLGDRRRPRRSARSTTGTAPAGSACPARTRPAGRGAAVARRDVVDDAHPVAEPVGAAPLDRLPDRRQPERLAGVDGEVEVLPLQVLERVQVPGGRVAGLGAGDVEADHARRRGTRTASSAISSSGPRAASRSAACRPGSAGPAAAASALPSANPACTASTTCGSVSPRSRCCSGREAHLGVDDAVGGQVQRALARPPGAAPPRSASPRRCARTSPGSAPASRSRPRRRTSRPAPPDRSAGSACPISRGQLDDRSPGAARRRGGRAAAPWGP